MERIESILQLDDAVRRYRHGRNHIYTNCFLLREQLEKLIKGGRLYLDCGTNLLQVVCDEGEYYHLYFYALLENDFSFSEYDKPVLCDMLCTSPIRDRDALAQKRIEESGFTLHAENLQFVGSAFEHMEKAKSDFSALMEKITSDGYRLVRAEKEDLAGICDLWERNLDMFVFPYAWKDELKGSFSKKKIHCIKDGSGNICAARQCENIGKRQLGSHLVVDQPYRRMGFARTLLLKQIIVANTDGCDCIFFWIEKHNEPSIELHTMWADLNQKVSRQYVKYVVH